MNRFSSHPSPAPYLQKPPGSRLAAIGGVCWNALLLLLALVSLSVATVQSNDATLHGTGTNGTTEQMTRSSPLGSQPLHSPDQVPEGLAKSDWSSIRAAYEAGRHAFQPVEGGWQARNPGQQWTTKFDGRGFLAKPRDANWQWGLEFKSYGFGEQQTQVGGTQAVRNEGQRLTYQWNDSVLEWFVNDTRGLEHGFTVTRRPDADGGLSTSGTLLSFTLATRGTLRPSISSDALTVHFRDASNAPVLNYSGLKVWDADGKILPSRFEAAGENQVRLLVEESGARYPLTIDPIAQQAYLKAGNNGGLTDDYFGNSVAVSGDTVVVGANQEDSSTTGVNSTPNESAVNSGAAYVFSRSGTTWSQQAYLKASNTGAGDLFGYSVTMSGDTVVIGAWQEDSSTKGVNSTPNESAGGSGATYVFTRSGMTWSQQAYLKAGNTGAGDLFGYSVAVSGDAIVVGAWQEDSSTTGVNSTPNEGAGGSGAAYVFTRSGTTWSQQAYLKAGNTGMNHNFGFSVAVSGDTVVVGAYGEGSSSTGVNSIPIPNTDSAGAAYVFMRRGMLWSQQAYLKASNTQLGINGKNDEFGYSVAISGNTIVAGTWLEDSSSTGVNSTPNESAISAGAAYVFVRIGTTWSQEAYLKASNTGVNDRFGISVAVSGDTVVIGAFQEDSSTTGVNSTPNESAGNSGAAYVFTRSGTTWSQQAYLKASNTGTGDQFGLSVAVSGDTVTVGAYQEDSNTTGVNSTPNESVFNSGAAYVYTRSGTTWSQQAYFKASNTETTGGPGVGDEFGSSVAISGDTAIIGAPWENSSSTGVDSIPNESGHSRGAAYIFVRSGTIWSQQAYLKGSTSAQNFGKSVAVSGDTAVVGHLYDSSGPYDSSASGAIYIYVRSGVTWSQQAYLKASNPGVNDAFGQSVAVSGETVVVGAGGENSGTTGVNSTPNESALASGAAYVFVRNGSTWIQQAYLKASNPGSEDRFGEAVALSGDTVVIGSREGSSTTGVNTTPNENAYNSGAAYVFTRSGTTWSQQAYLKASNTGVYDQFGISVAVSGDTAIIGAGGEDSSTTGVNSSPNELALSAGAAYIFTRSDTIWSQQAYLKASNSEFSDRFGDSVAISGNTVVVGSTGEDSSSSGINGTSNEGASTSGAAYVFVKTGTTWSEQAYLKASNPGADDFFGRSVAISGDTVVVGALREDGRNSEGDSNPNELSYNSGASYMFTGLGPIIQIPALGSANATMITATTVALSGFVINDGGSPFTEHGVIYSSSSVNPNPSIGDFGVTQLATSGTTNSFTIDVSDLSPGADYSFKAYATNSVGTSYTNTATFTMATVSALLSTWATTSGLTVEGAAPTATPFNDGVPNLLKYAFNMNASEPDVSVLTTGGSAGLPQITVDQSGPEPVLRVAFLRRKGSGLIYTPQRSAALDTFVSMTGAETVTAINDQWEQVTVTETNLLPPATTSFARVQVAIP